MYFFTIHVDLFDALVKLTYNMQLYVAALKVAITWKQNCNLNLNTYHRFRHHDNLKTSKTTSKTEETSNIGDPMDVDDGKIDTPPFLSSVDMAKGDDISQLSSSRPHTFLQVVAFAKNLVFSSQDDANMVNVDLNIMANDDEEFKMHHEDNSVIDNIIDIPIVDSENEEQNILLLESYGRQCTLPFLRFAALLKKYINEDDENNLDDNQDLSTLPLSQQQQQQSNSNVENELLKNTSCVNECLHKNNSSCCHQWSHDDYEYLTLTCFLKLINYNVETYEHCDSCKDIDNSNSCKNNKNHGSNHENIKPPSAMEAVIWPKWSYSTSDKNDNISTTISRAWLTSFRQALAPSIPRATIICENTNVSPATLELDPNSSANILMAARLLLAVDCCDGGLSKYYRNTSEINDGNLNRGLRLLPTIKWTGPRLLKLPHCYDDVFQYYHGRPCLRCHGIPRESSLCLICGTVVCLKENCCKTNDIFEAVQVSIFI